MFKFVNKRIMLSGAILIVISSCSIFSPVKDDKLSHYIIKVDGVKVNKEYCVYKASNDVLQLTPMSALAPFGRTKMYYTNRSYKLEAYAYHKWSTSPAEMIQQSLQTSLMGSCLFKDIVLSEVNTIPASYRLNTRILSIKQVINTKTSVVIVEVLAQYIDNTTNNLISSNVFKETSEQYANALGYVYGVNIDSEKLISDIIKWLRVLPTSKQISINIIKKG